MPVTLLHIMNLVSILPELYPLFAVNPNLKCQNYSDIIEQQKDCLEWTGLHFGETEVTDTRINGKLYKDTR